MLQEIRDLVQRAPFSPFTIHLADGRVLRVPYPDFVWLPKPGVFFFFHNERGSSERINPLLIVSVESANGSESR
jgi:hypothetical protein